MIPLLAVSRSPGCSGTLAVAGPNGSQGSIAVWNEPSSKPLPQSQNQVQKSHVQATARFSRGAKGGMPATRALSSHTAPAAVGLRPAMGRLLFRRTQPLNGGCSTRELNFPAFRAFRLNSSTFLRLKVTPRYAQTRQPTTTGRNHSIVMGDLSMPNSIRRFWLSGAR